MAESFIAKGLPLVIVQPGLIYGPGDAGPSHDAFVQMLQRKLPMLPQKTAYCWALMGVVEKVISVPANYTAEYLRVSAGVTYIGSNAKARRQLGFNPRSLAEGLRQAIALEMQALGMKK